MRTGKRSAPLFLLAALSGFAQTAQITGRVTDTSEALVPGVTVTVTNVATGVAKKAATNEQGYYTLPLLPPGRYQMLVQHGGFKPISREGIVLTVDQVARIDFMLEVGALAESVEVVGAAPLVESSSATVGKVIENRRVAELPLSGRNALALVMLAPGVRSPVGPTNSGFISRGTHLSSISINGGPVGLNNFLLDGGSNNQGYNADLNINPTVDSIEEFKVQTNTVSSEYGFTAGGIINVVTKSGTNQLHGSLYEFVRNDAFDARNAFASTKAPFRYNQFGGAAGGPVYLPKIYDGRRRSFFFYNFEEWRYLQYSQPIIRVPTQAERQGDFSGLRDAAGALIGIFDPGTTRANPAGSGYVRDQFPGNLVPAGRPDPVSKNILPFYPLPNRAPSDPYTNSNNYIGSSKENRWMRQHTFRIDHKVSDKNSLFVRLSSFQHYTYGLAGGGASPYPDPVVRSRTDNYVTQNVILTDTHAVSPRLLNEFRLGMTRMNFTYEAESYNQGWPQKLGLPASHPPEFFPIISNGLSGFTIGATGYRTTLSPQLTDTFTAIRGRHTFKLGMDLRTQQANQFLLRSPSGTFNFAATLTGNPQRPAGTGFGFATYLLGAVSSASATTHVGFAQEGYSTSFFFQDDWKVTSRLTLNLGIRHDYQQWPVERHNGTSNFDPHGVNPLNGLRGRVGYAGIDYGRAAMAPDRNNWGPRFGFAYDVSGKGKMAVRGSYGIFYPFIFFRQFYGSSAGFSETTTNYLPPGGNINFTAFQFKDGFPSPPTPPLGSKLGPSAFLGENVSYSESTGQTPMSQQWSLSVQRELPHAWLLDVTYSGNHGTHLVGGAYDLNQLDPWYYALGLGLQDRVPNPYAGIVPGSLGTATLTRSQALRPFPYYNTISVTEPGPTLGNSIYHSLLISGEKRLARGFALLVSYTNAKLINDSSRSAGLLDDTEQAGVTGYQNGKFDRRSERSLDATDVSQRLVASGIYELPAGRGRAWDPGNALVRGLVGGWQLNAILTAQSGLPVVVRGASNFRADRPNSTGGSAEVEDRTASRWFDTTAFVNPPDFTLGNVGRVLADVRNPGAVNVDFSAIKNTPVRERLKIQFRAEAFNFANHVNLGAPNATFVPGTDGRNRSGTFGTINSARAARILQLGLKVLF